MSTDAPPATQGPAAPGDPPPRVPPKVAAAQMQAEALLTAAKNSPIRQIRYELHARGVEWQRALNLLETCEEVGDQATIELVGSIVPAMVVVTEKGNGEVIRQLARDGQVSLHVLEGNGRETYLNFRSAASPCVVLA